jgi:putative hydrolase of the HAD superfamily
MNQTRNLLFDLGKVLLDFDNNNAATYFTALGISDFAYRHRRLAEKNIFNEFETGAITSESFIDIISEEVHGKIPAGDIIKAWNSILIGFRVPSMQYLANLKSQYQLYLLSNTNPIHLEAIQKMAITELNGQQLENYFIKAFYSHLTGYRKPSSEIYQRVLSDTGIIAEETIFIDDLPENIAAAAQLGFKTRLLLPEERIENIDFTHI